MAQAHTFLRDLPTLRPIHRLYTIDSMSYLDTPRNLAQAQQRHEAWKKERAPDMGERGGGEERKNIHAGRERQRELKRIEMGSLESCGRDISAGLVGLSAFSVVVICMLRTLCLVAVVFCLLLFC
jgi:hypothetical protein